MRSIKEIKNLKGKKVLVRVDFNVPISGGKITDDFRIKKTLPTIEYLKKNGAKIVLIAHLGDSGAESLSIVADYLKKYIKNFQFINTPILSTETENSIKSISDGGVALLENLRKEEGEKKNSPSFARALSRNFDIYINEAFSVCHRAHASIVGLPKYLESYAGFQLEKEIKELSKSFNPKHLFLFILGGAKFETKIPLIKRFLRSSDNIFLAGAISNDFFLAKGYQVGESVVSKNIFDIPKLLKNQKIVLPIDVKVTSAGGIRNTKPEEVKNNESIIDIGTETIKNLKELIKKSKFVLWNGPLGLYENGHGGGTEEIIKFISKSKIDSVIGGGDTVAIISKIKYEDKLGFVSTGGGATLDFLTNGSLPGIKALK